MKNLNINKTYLVTGAVGFIGMHLSSKLLSLGCKVIGIDNINDYYDTNLKYTRLNILEKHEKFEFYREDLVNKELLEKIFNESKIDIVIHLAAQAGVRYSLDNPDAYIHSNILGFINILEVCRTYKVEHLLYASSSSVYGANTKIPFATEDIVDRPVSLYAATKKSGELMAYAYSHLFNIPTTGLRFFTVYGPYGRPDMAYFSFTKNIIEGKAIKVFNNGDMYRDFTYIDDIIDAILKLIPNSSALDKTPPYNIYNVGNNKPEKLLDFIKCIENALGREAIKEYLPMQAGDVERTYADISGLNKDIAFQPSTSINEGIDKFVKWYKEWQIV
jgi:UDP-glucuronate 4-epimerase